MREIFEVITENIMIDFLSKGFEVLKKDNKY